MNEDYRDMLSALSARGAEFLVVGAYAVGVHGHPRATMDLDLWVNATPDNAPRVLDALGAFGAPLFGLSAADLRAPGVGLHIGAPPRRIDILTEVSGVDFAEAWPERVVALLGGWEVPVIGREHLIKNKLAAGRPKDLADVAALTRGTGAG